MHRSRARDDTDRLTDDTNFRDGMAESPALRSAVRAKMFTPLDRPMLVAESGARKNNCQQPATIISVGQDRWSRDRWSRAVPSQTPG